jgi:hypothetical protein
MPKYEVVLSRQVRIEVEAENYGDATCRAIAQHSDGEFNEQWENAPVHVDHVSEPWD